MTDNVISLAEWIAKHRPERRKVPVYCPVPDPNGGYRLEFVEVVPLEPEDLELKPWRSNSGWPW